MAGPRICGPWIWACAISILLTGCAGDFSHPSAYRGLPQPSRDVLPNGLRLIIQEHRATDAVALHLWVGVGGRDERPGERGFSHFAEHMLFKGTERRPRGFVEHEVESVGGRTNAGTSYDYTFYYILVPAARAIPSIEVLADMAFNSKFDPVELGREREVVFEEVRLGDDNARSSLFRRLYDLAFDGHPYGSPVLGDPGDLRAATQASLRGYYKRHYTPENMALVVVGAVDPAQVRAAAARWFGSVPAAGNKRAALPAQPAIHGVKRQTVERPERQGSFALGWSAPSLGQPDMYAVDLLAHILGGSRSSRLNQALRERARLVSAVNAGYGALQWGGLLTISAQFEPKDEADVEAGILGEVRRIRDEGVSDAEVERAVTASESERAFSRETVEGLALAYGRAETVWSVEEERRYVERLRSVTGGEIREAARRYLTDSYVRMALLPKGKGS